MGLMRDTVFFAIFVIYAAAFWWDLQYIAPGRKVAGMQGVAARLCFLTFWNLLVYFGCVAGQVLANAASGRRSHSSTPSSLRCYISRGIVGPVGTFVTISFWGIYAFDRELIFPKTLDAFIPSWWNHAAHTLPLISTLVDRYLCAFARHADSKPWRPLGLTVGVTLSYLLWILYLGLVKSFWVYPVLHVLGTAGRAAFIAAGAVVFAVIYRAVDAVARFFWSDAIWTTPSDPHHQRQQHHGRGRPATSKPKSK